MIWLLVGLLVIALLGLLVAAVAGLPSLLYRPRGGLDGACPPRRKRLAHSPRTTRACLTNPRGCAILTGRVLMSSIQVGWSRSRHGRERSARRVHRRTAGCAPRPPAPARAGGCADRGWSRRGLARRGRRRRPLLRPGSHLRRHRPRAGR